MRLPFSTLETHEAGTLSQQAIINANWRILEAILNPDLSDTDPTYGSLYGAIERALNGQRGMETVAPVATPTYTEVSLKGTRIQKVTLSGNINLQAIDRIAGREVSLVIKGDGSSRTLTWNASHIWVETPLTTLAAGKTAAVNIYCTGTTNADIILRADVQA